MEADETIRIKLFGSYWFKRKNHSHFWQIPNLDFQLPITITAKTEHSPLLGLSNDGNIACIVALLFSLKLFKAPKKISRRRKRGLVEQSKVFWIKLDLLLTYCKPMPPWNPTVEHFTFFSKIRSSLPKDAHLIISQT